MKLLLSCTNPLMCALAPHLNKKSQNSESSIMLLWQIQPPLGIPNSHRESRPHLNKKSQNSESSIMLLWQIQPPLGIPNSHRESRPHLNKKSQNSESSIMLLWQIQPPLGIPNSHRESQAMFRLQLTILKNKINKFFEVYPDLWQFYIYTLNHWLLWSLCMEFYKVKCKEEVTAMR